MTQQPGDDNERGMSIRVSIPAQNGELYNIGGTDEILLFLSRNRYDQFTQRELAAKVGVSQTTTSRAVSVLEENQLVRVEHDGNRKLVEINRERLTVPEDPALRIPQEEFQEPAREAGEKLRESLEGVHAIVLYGSVARGDADRRSDVDLWVLVEDERAANQREANAVGNDLEERKFGGDRYQFHVVVESIESVPAFTEEVEGIVDAGIALYATPTYQKLKNILAHEGQ